MVYSWGACYTVCMVFEIIGYVGSALVVVSMLMTSVVKLRIINMAGSIIFAIYAFCINSYPTAAMQICLIIINIVSLYKLLAVKKEYSVTKLDSKDSYLKYFLNTYQADIQKFFPSSQVNEDDIVYLVCCDTNPAGIFIAEKTSEEANGIIQTRVDYTTPRYRDGSAGKFLYEFLSTQSFSKVIAESSNSAHQAYLRRMGFKKSIPENSTQFYKDLSNLSL